MIYGIWLLASHSNAFIQQPNAGWVGDRIFQPSTVEHRYPPILDVLDPRRTSPSDRRGSVLHEGRMNEVCSVQGDEEGFVMSYDEAHELVNEAYPGFIEVSEDCKISEWQAAKKIYHAKGVGINPADYGFVQDELNLIRKEEAIKRVDW